MSSGGYVYSHINASVNGQQKSFEFKAGDKLYFELDLKNGRLKVVKNNVQQYEMDVEMDKSEEYAICAYLYDGGDFIELI